MSNKDGNQIRAAIWELSRLLEDVDTQDRQVYLHDTLQDQQRQIRVDYACKLAWTWAQEEALGRWEN